MTLWIKFFLLKQVAKSEGQIGCSAVGVGAGFSSIVNSSLTWSPGGFRSLSQLTWNTVRASQSGDLRSDQGLSIWTTATFPASSVTARCGTRTTNSAPRFEEASSVFDVLVEASGAHEMARMRIICLSLSRLASSKALGKMLASAKTSIALLITRTLSQEAATLGSEAEAHNDSTWFDVKMASAKRLCLANGIVDHDRATTVPSDCSSPMEKLSRSDNGCVGHSSTVNELILKLTCIHGSRSKGWRRPLPWLRLGIFHEVSMLKLQKMGGEV